MRKGVSVSSHILQGKMTFSKYAKSGFWFTDQISIKDEVGNERHSGVDDFGWKLFLDNALEDVEAPQYIEDSLEMMLETAVVEGQTIQRLKVRWKITENRMMASHPNCYVSLLPPGNEAYRLEQYGYGIDDGNDGFDSSQNVCRVDFLIPNFYRSGTTRCK